MQPFKTSTSADPAITSILQKLDAFRLVQLVNSSREEAVLLAHLDNL
jgi:hypothetical protein